MQKFYPLYRSLTPANLRGAHRHFLVSHIKVAARFHHRLVLIHCFPNGNGRHARLMADLLLMKNGVQRFSWGGGIFQSSKDEMRKLYIQSLRQADKNDIDPLLKFVRS